MKFKKVLAAVLAVCTAILSPMSVLAYGNEGSNVIGNAEVMENLESDWYLGIPYFPSDKCLQNYEISAKIADEIAGNETDDYKKAELLFKWIVSTVKYNEQEAIRLMAEHNLHENGYQGVCNDFAELFNELCWSQNIPCAFIAGMADFGEGEGAHAWNAFYANGKWHWADPSGYSLEYFDISQSMMDSCYFGERAYVCKFISEWAKPSIKTAMKNGLLDPYFMKSITSCFGTVRMIRVNFPDPCTRLGFAQLAVNLLEQCDINTDVTINTNTFTDTQDRDVLVANALGIVSGNPDGTFNPEGEITRQEAAAILARTAKVLGLNASGADVSVFTDADTISGWAKDSVAFCKEMGIMSGTTATTFDPHGAYTNEQCVATIVRLFESTK